MRVFLFLNHGLFYGTRLFGTVIINNLCFIVAYGMQILFDRQFRRCLWQAFSLGKLAWDVVSETSFSGSSI